MFRRHVQTARPLADALESIGDRLVAGNSLRQAITFAVVDDDADAFRGVTDALDAGRPIVDALRDLATAKRDDDPDLSAACCVLAMHASLGGDPTPACRALANRLLRRDGARAEAKALTTQTRLGARAILLLTPAFLLLVSFTDPRGPVHAIFDPRVRAAVALGLFLQCLGAAWISAIVGGVAGGASRLQRVPVLRAAHAIVAGRGKTSGDDAWAEGAELFAFALEAGLSPSTAVNEIAPFAGGSFGSAIRPLVTDPPSPIATVADALTDTGSDTGRRFARSLRWSTELGVPLAPAMRALAADLHDADRLRLTTDVRKASIKVLLPLGVLILPAFVLACLVPLFVGGMSSLAGT